MSEKKDMSERKVDMPESIVDEIIEIDSLLRQYSVAAKKLDASHKIISGRIEAVAIDASEYLAFQCIKYDAIRINFNDHCVEIKHGTDTENISEPEVEVDDDGTDAVVDMLYDLPIEKRMKIVKALADRMRDSW